MSCGIARHPPSHLASAGCDGLRHPSTTVQQNKGAVSCREKEGKGEMAERRQGFIAIEQRPQRNLTKRALLLTKKELLQGMVEYMQAGEEGEEPPYKQRHV